MDYMKKCMSLLNDTKTYQLLMKDSTQKYKKHFATVLRELMERACTIDKELHRNYPTMETPPKFDGLLKEHSSTTRQSVYHVKNSRDFCDKIM